MRSQKVLFNLTYLVAWSLPSLPTLDTQLSLILRPASSPGLGEVCEEGRDLGGGGGGLYY